MRSILRKLVIGGVVSVATLCAARQTHALSVELSGTALTVVAGPDEENFLDVVFDEDTGCFIVDDLGNTFAGDEIPVTVKGSCVKDVPNENVKCCKSPVATIVVVDVKNGDDLLSVETVDTPAQTYIAGGDGDDYIEVTAVTTTVDAGNGNDTVNVTAVTGAATVQGGEGADFLMGDETSTLNGGNGNDVLWGTGTLDGQGGADVMYGGTISYAARTAAVSVTVANGAADDGVAGEGDQVVVADRVVGGSGNDTLIGSPTVITILEGGNGNDVLRDGARMYGGAGNDRLSVLALTNAFVIYDGGPGDDILYGGNGPDEMTGGPGADFIASYGDNDYILANDGERDVINCGAGSDNVWIDGADFYGYCETIN